MQEQVQGAHLAIRISPQIRFLHRLDSLPHLLRNQPPPPPPPDRTTLLGSTSRLHLLLPLVLRSNHQVPEAICSAIASGFPLRQDQRQGFLDLKARCNNSSKQHSCRRKGSPLWIPVRF
jgi:hypothetical protein